MATGACGIDCGACRLNRVGICSTCGPATSPEGARKMEAQQRILGDACPVLTCAWMKGVAHCSRDCLDFPCEIFRRGPYPYSAGFLAMQERRRREGRRVAAPTGSMQASIATLWERVRERDVDELASAALARVEGEGALVFPFLNREIRVEPDSGQVLWGKAGRFEAVRNPMLELLVAVYLHRVRPLPPADEMVTVRDFRDARFFEGPHELPTGLLLDLYGEDLPAFREAAARMGGLPLGIGDAACRFPVLPRIPLFMILRAGDPEFAATLSILCDRSIEGQLPADAIWGLVHLVTDFLVLGG